MQSYVLKQKNNLMHSHVLKQEQFIAKSRAQTVKAFFLFFIHIFKFFKIHFLFLERFSEVL